MADLKISQLPALGDNLATADKIALVDSSSSETKSLSIANLFSANSFALLGSNAIPIAKVSVGAGTIAGTAVADLGISTSKVANDAITSGKLADNSSAQIVTSLPGSGAFTGQIASNSNDGYAASIWDGSAWQSLKAAASINTINGDTTSIVNIAVASSGSTRTISASLDDASAAAQFMAGPSGAAGAVSLRAITGADLPTATSSALGAIKVNGEGLRMDTGVIEIDNDVTASSAFNLVSISAKGLVTNARVIQSSDLPDGSSSAKGALQVGTGLAVSSGVISVDNSATPGTFTKVTITATGAVSSGTTLSASDLPAHSAALLTSGNLDIARVPTNAITGAKLADGATTLFGGPGSTSEIVTFPSARYKGDRFFDEYHSDEYLWTGNSWVAITITGGELIYAGTYSASSNTVVSITTAGAAAGLQTGSGLPTPSATNIRAYVVVSQSGTGSGNAPAVALAPPDMLVSNGSNAWDLIDVSNAIAGQTSSNISFTPYGNIASTNAQAAIQELDDEKVGKAGVNTITGTLEIGTTGVLKFEGSTANAYEIQLSSADPLQASRNIVLPDQSGNVLVQGNASLVNADVATNCALAYSKLAALANGSILIGSASNVATVQALGGDATLSNAGVLTIAASAITNTKVSSSAAIAGTKIAPNFGNQNIETTGNLTVNNQSDLRLGDSDGSHYIALQAGATIASNFTLTLPVADGSSGQVLSTDGSGTLSFITPATSTNPVFSGDLALQGGNIEGYASLQAPFGTTKNFTVTVAAKTAAHRYDGTGSSNGYKIDGTESAFLVLTPGRTYRFLQNDSSNSGHPLRFYLDAAKTVAFTTDCTFNGTAGSSGAYSEIEVTDSTPQVLFYQCSAHAYMGNSMQTNSNVASTALTVTQAAQSAITSLGTLTSLGISGNLTVDTSTLHVDASNNRVGIGTTSPAVPLHVIGETRIDPASGQSTLRFSIGGTEKGKVAVDSSSNVVIESAGTTALTLDSSQNATFAGSVTSTGLTVDTNTDASVFVNTTNANGAHIRLQNSGTTKTYLGQASGISGTLGNANDFAIRSAEDIVFSTNDNNTPNVKIDSSGRVGIGTSSMGSYNGSADDLVIDNGASDVGITLDSETQCSIGFTDATTTNWDGWIKYIHSSNSLQFGASQGVALTIDSSQNATFAGTVSDSKGNLRDIVQNVKTSAYTLVASDAGKCVQNSSGGWTIPASTFSGGNAVTLLNNSASAQNITATALTYLWNTADGANIKANTIALGARTMATIWFMSGAEGYIQAGSITVS